jgi:CO/xanthine dehydrogenase Mo-binding subunit
VVAELTTVLYIDLLSLRLQNDAQTDVLTGMRLFSRFPPECIQLGARHFSWAACMLQPETIPAPGST